MVNLLEGEKRQGKHLEALGWPEHCDDPTWLSEATEAKQRQIRDVMLMKR